MISKDIKDICELFDCQICQDITQKSERSKIRPVYYLGTYSEKSAGLWGYELTPYFYSEKSLIHYCTSKKGRAAINQKAGEIFADWNINKQDWKV